MKAECEHGKHTSISCDKCVIDYQAKKIKELKGKIKEGQKETTYWRTRYEWEISEYEAAKF